MIFGYGPRKDWLILAVILLGGVLFGLWGHRHHKWFLCAKPPNKDAAARCWDETWVFASKTARADACKGHLEPPACYVCPGPWCDR